MLPDGMFWQFDVRDAMEESISGGRKVKNVRPTINSYMAANAAARTEMETFEDDVAVRIGLLPPQTQILSPLHL